MTLKLRNIGPKSAAWLRQVGLRTPEELAAVGAVGAYVKVRRAGFKPSLNLLYALEGALADCHWQDVPDVRRAELVQAAEAAIAQLPPPRGRPAAAPVTTTHHEAAGMAPGLALFDDERSPAAADD
ncbi:TfoX/Sxy family protein [Thermomonas sp. S9]|uniref:TfoX/Sxy family protein n=1 Tax=Thermomonas sp. S9 TaxID=2885203 RepID=UPI00216AD519|nr:TfoX/Sxy family protein [Thermomonas sp. S9]MCR6495329.1 TfoX/Sxy family protein [Thermomonas sp. S9]